jgi:hypothetical protein
MYKKILLCGMIGILSNYSYATPEDLEKRKVTLTADILKEVSNCKCLMQQVEGQEKLFPLKKKFFNAPKLGINTQAEYIAIIANMKINAGRTQTKAKAILRDWPVNQNSPEDLKKLDVAVSEELRALSSFCINVFTPVADEIYKRSSVNSPKNKPSEKIKIDPKVCGVVQNK